MKTMNLKTQKMFTDLGIAINNSDTKTIVSLTNEIKGMGLSIKVSPKTPVLPSLPKLSIDKEEWLGFSIDSPNWGNTDFYIRDVYSNGDELRMIVVDEGFRDRPLIKNRKAFSPYDYSDYIQIVVKKTPKKRTGTHSVTIGCIGTYTDSKKWNSFYNKTPKSFFHYELNTSDVCSPAILLGKIGEDMNHIVNLVCESRNVRIEKSINNK